MRQYNESTWEWDFFVLHCSYLQFFFAYISCRTPTQHRRIDNVLHIIFFLCCIFSFFSFSDWSQFLFFWHCATRLFTRSLYMYRKNQYRHFFSGFFSFSTCECEEKVRKILKLLNFLSFFTSVWVKLGRPGGWSFKKGCFLVPCGICRIFKDNLL